MPGSLALARGFRPYPSYKDSGVPWVAQVPDHWQVLPGFATFAPKLAKNSGMVEKTVLSLSYGQIIVKPGERLHGLVPESFETYQIVDPGDIILRTTDLQNDQVSLRVGKVRQRGIITSAYLCLRAHSHLSDDYAYLLLNSYDLMKVFYGYGSGLRQNLDFTHIKRMPIVVPPSQEQAAIVRFLDHTNRRIRSYIAAKKKLIGLLNEEKQAIINHAVTRGLDPNVHLKPSGVEWLGNVPAHWDAYRLKHVATIQTGITLGKNYGSVSLVERPYLRVANVQTGKLDLSHVTTIRLPASEAAASLLRKGDVLMTEGGDIDKLGRGCVWNGEIPDCLHQNHVFAVRPRQVAMLPGFLVALMASRHGRSYFERTAKKTTNLASTNSTTLGSFPVLLPTVDEQQQILEWIDGHTRPLTRAVDRAELEIALIREYRTRLIADVVTGKLDVREVAAGLPDEVEAAEALEYTDALVDSEEGTEDTGFEESAATGIIETDSQMD